MQIRREVLSIDWGSNRDQTEKNYAMVVIVYLNPWILFLFYFILFFDLISFIS